MRNALLIALLLIAAAEVASEEYFNPVVPEDLAERLRQLTRAAS